MGAVQQKTGVNNGGAYKNNKRESYKTGKYLRENPKSNKAPGPQSQEYRANEFYGVFCHPNGMISGENLREKYVLCVLPKGEHRKEKSNCKKKKTKIEIYPFALYSSFVVKIEENSNDAGKQKHPYF